MLPANEAAFLNDRFPAHVLQLEGGMICLLVPRYQMPDGLAPSEATLLLRLNPGFPDVPPDMWWFDPAVKRVDGNFPIATNHFEGYLGRTWQRWSRHFADGQWKAGVDSLESYFALINAELKRSAMRNAA